MNVDQLELGAIIRKRRKELGLTLSDLATDNLSVPTISNIERGISNVNRQKLDYIMERLQLTGDLIENMSSAKVQEQKLLDRKVTIIRSLIELKLYDQARTALQELEQKDSIRERPEYEATVHLLKGTLYRKQESWKRADSALMKAIQRAQESEIDTRTNIVAEAYHVLSFCAFYSDQDYKKAAHYADEALNAFDEDGDRPFLKGRILCDKATYYFHMERYASAYKYVMNAQKICQRTHDLRGLVYTYNLEGMILGQQGLHDESIDAYIRAIRILCIKGPDLDLASIVYLNLGETHQLKDEYEEAHTCYHIALQAGKKTGNKMLLAATHTALGKLYYERGDYDRAREYTTYATEFSQYSRPKSEYLQLLLLRAKIALKLSIKEEFISTCQEGIALAQQTNLPAREKEFTYILAQYYDNKGDKKKFSQYTEILFKLESIVKEGVQ